MSKPNEPAANAPAPGTNAGGTGGSAGGGAPDPSSSSSNQQQPAGSNQSPSPGANANPPASSQSGSSSDSLAGPGKTPTNSTGDGKGGSTPEAGKGPDGKTSTGQEPAVPEKYDLKLPKDSMLTAKDLEAISSKSKELKLSQEQAQAMVEARSEAVAHFFEGQKQELKTKNETTWRQELESDKEVGGQAFEQNGQLAFRAAEKWFGPGFVQMLRDMNFNHNPIVFKGLVRLGKAMAEDQIVVPSAQVGVINPDAASVLYPSHNKEQ